MREKVKFRASEGVEMITTSAIHATAAITATSERRFSNPSTEKAASSR